MTRRAFTEEFNPHALPPYRLFEAAATLSVLAVEILALREKLGLPTRQIPAEIFRTHLQRNANIADQHRLGPQRLAAELLRQLREPVSSTDI